MPNPPTVSERSTELNNLFFVPTLARIFHPHDFGSFIVGVYFLRESAAVVFINTAGKVIDTGVYGRVRRPMYLGELLILLGFSISTLSILSFIVWIAFFIFIDKMATYEEKDLTRILGQQYSGYKKRVYKW